MFADKKFITTSENIDKPKIYYHMLKLFLTVNFLRKAGQQCQFVLTSGK
jgi:hypothetical protein